jgi:hypothetical protein
LKHKSSDGSFQLGLTYIIATIVLFSYLMSMAAFTILTFAYNTQGLNGHLFGALDFYDFFGLLESTHMLDIPWTSVQFGENPWDLTWPTPYSSIGLVIFKFIASIIPSSPQAIINSAIVFNLLGAVSLSFPIYDALRNQNKIFRVLPSFIIGCLTYPAILGFSRANFAIIMITPLYLILKYARTNPKNGKIWIISSIVLTAGIKFNYLSILIFFFKENLRKTILIPSILTILLLYFLGFKFFSGDYFTMIQGHFMALSNFSYRPDEAQLVFFNTSLVAGCATFARVFFGDQNLTLDFLYSHQYLPGVIYLLVAVIILFMKRCPFWFKSFLLLSSLTMVPGISFGYSSTYLIIVLALMFSDERLEEQVKVRNKKLQAFSNFVLYTGVFLISSSDFFWLKFSPEIATSSKSLSIPLGTLLLLTFAFRLPRKSKEGDSARINQ